MGITRYGTTGRDSLTGTTTDDRLHGLAGDDTLNGLTGNDTLYGGGGNDSLRGDEGDLSFYGGPGNDTLSTGGTARMTAYFGRGDGQDHIAGHPDWADSVNTLQFTGRLTMRDIAVSVSGSALVLSIRGTTDSVTIDRFYNYGPPNAEGSNMGGGMTGVQVVRFPDGTAWSLADLKALVFAGTPGADSIRGSYQEDRISGGSGNDTLLGFGGNDLLQGGAGQDTLAGGTGNDTLDGATGGDTYQFGRGGGNDLIRDVDRSIAEVDVLQFLSGINREQVWLRRVGSGLEVSLIGTSDKVTVQNWYGSPAFHVEQFRTADGQVLRDTQVNQLVSAMAAFAPPPAGQTTLTAAYQAALHPVIATSWT
jgi:Ca2+-binding RTX toxin-like protein